MVGIYDDGEGVEFGKMGHSRVVKSEVWSDHAYNNQIIIIKR